MKVLIVGMGLAGTWLSRAAFDAGHEVEVVDDGGPSADRAALGLLRSTYLSKGLRPLMKPSLEAWRDAGMDLLDGARVTRWDTDKVKEQVDWHALNPQLPEPKYHFRWTGCPAEPMEPDCEGPKVRLGAHEVLASDVVFWCDGGGDGRRTYGYTWVHDDPGALLYPEGTGLRIHHVAPYKALAGARFPTTARLGSSSAPTWEKAREQAGKFFTRAVELGWVEPDPGWELVGGTRLLRDQVLTPRTELGPGHWRWSGFHRNGFSIVPATAATVLDVTL